MDDETLLPLAQWVIFLGVCQLLATIMLCVFLHQWASKLNRKLHRVESHLEAIRRHIRPAEEKEAEEFATPHS